MKIHLKDSSGRTVRTINDTIKTLDISFTDIAALPDLPALTHLDVSRCPLLAALPDLPALTHLYVRGCPLLAGWFMASGRMEAFLTGGGRSLAEVCRPEHWNCHLWSNCPTAAAYGVDKIERLPAGKRLDALIFVALFDAHLLRNPLEMKCPA